MLLALEQGNPEQNNGSEEKNPITMMSSTSIDEDEKEQLEFQKLPPPRRKSKADESVNLLHGSDPVTVELARLENELRDKDRELAEAQAEIKALRLIVRAKEKAVEELSEELNKVGEKLKATELLLENKSLEVKRVNDEKKAAVAAQSAAEATLRRIQAAQKDEDIPPIEEILAPLEAELKLARQEIAKSLEGNRALDRLTKSKEAALLEAERTIQIAEAKASLVDDLQNRNQELLKQIEICQEENKILDKMHRQKVAEVEKLSTCVAELEEAVLAGGATANTVRDYRRQIHEYMEEKKILERELAKAKIAANRVAVVVANEWKDASDKVMPVKQWLAERRVLQGEMQQLREKLVIAERTAKYEAQLKTLSSSSDDENQFPETHVDDKICDDVPGNLDEKYQVRLKVIEETVKVPANNGSARWLPSSMGEENLRTMNGYSRRQSFGGADDSSRKSINNRQRSTTPQSRGVSVSSRSVLKNVTSISKSFDGGQPSPRSSSAYGNGAQGGCQRSIITTSINSQQDAMDSKVAKVEGDCDTVSGVLYDMLQKEVIALRKGALEKDQSLKDKDDAIEMLSRKVDTLTKAMEVDAKKMRREVAAMEKEVAAMRVGGKEQESRARRPNNTAKIATNSSQLHAGRSATSQ